ncbi:MAG: hypothetical protein KDA45_10155 [Planctomycetales bacterium]|nr:hypothetical protein [Planctomycetales bacterium]
MQWMDREQFGRRVLAGTFLNLGSAAAVEIAAETGFDWLLIDLEHGSGSLADLRGMLLACRGSATAPVVRIRSVEPDTVKFVLDSGAAGIMFPFISSPEEAKRAVDCVKYPPRGTRGVAGIIRATHYGRNWQQYFAEANEQSLVVVQIETPTAVEAAVDIAGVEGVDVLFVGPLDLSVSMGCPGDFTQPHFVRALEKVVAACRAKGKPCGILSRPELVQQHIELGFQFLALGSDSGAVASGLTGYLRSMQAGGGASAQGQT